MFLWGKDRFRKCRLFAAACCRRIWALLTEQRSRQAVEVAERYADELADTDQLEKCFQEASREDDSFGNATEAAAWATAWDDRQAAEEAAIYAAYAVDEANHSPQPAKGRWGLAGTEERAAQVELIRDIFGNPFRGMPTVTPSVLRWQDGIVVRLAQAAYDDRLLPGGHLDPARLAVLADALEEAGCTDGEILGHLRGPGPHVRGCHLVDLLIGNS